MGLLTHTHTGSLPHLLLEASGTRNLTTKEEPKLTLHKAVMGQMKRYPLEIPNIEVLLDSARGDRLCAQGAPHLRVVEQ